MRLTLRFAVVAAVWACLSLPLTGSGDAEARMVLIRPSVARSCPGSSTWRATLTCVQRFGTAKIVRSNGNLRLVLLHARADEFRTSGLYLYIHDKKSWRVGGMVLDAKPTVIGLSTPSYDHKRLVRIDLVYAANEDIMIDEVSSRNAFVRRKTSYFCGGSSSSCSPIVTACDVFVGGRLHSTFRGTLTYQGGGIMSVTGDRSRAGAQCAQPDETFIPVPATLDIDALE